MRVRITAPVAFNGERRVFQGEEFDLPEGTPLYPWMELLDDVAPAKPKAAGKVGVKAPAKPQLRDADSLVG